ncbi:MAG: L,D-transpeptidase family protein [Actinobacteria bacterium]|nr:L,D-transpeptidase family protein [Actinomycetota bacterium]
MNEEDGGGLRRWLTRLGAAVGIVVVAWVIGAALANTSVPSSGTGGIGIRLNTDHTGHLPWQDRMVLTARAARLEQVEIADADGVALSGAVDSTGMRWRSTDPLVPELTYSIRTELVDPYGRGHIRTTHVTTSPPKQRVTATITPGDNDVVGIGMPIVVRFDHDVAATSRANVLEHLRVETSPPTEGAWRWTTPRQVHWRSHDYWTPHTGVTATADLGRVDFGGGSWGIGRHVVHFAIGDAHVSVADASTHTMVVTNNGQPVRTLPISAGRQAYPSRNGVHIALSKDPVVTMDSATVGIPRNSPDGYYEKVQWDVRISYAGAFVHAAPWSVPDQGQRNVSHGCINLSTADAQWFYDFTQRGDIIDIHSAGAAPDLADPGTMDWNLSWEAWNSA